MKKKELHTKKEDFDSALLIKDREQLFNEIQTSAQEGDLDISSIKRIFEHSIEDGIKIAEKLRLPPKDIVECITQPRFVHKHPVFAKQLRLKALLKAEACKDKVLCASLVQAPEELTLFEKHGQENILLEKHLFPLHGGYSYTLSKDQEELLKKIDDYYSQFLAGRDFKFQVERNQVKAVENSEEFLRRNEEMLEGKYSAPSLERIIFDEIKKEHLNSFASAVANVWTTSAAAREQYPSFEEMLADLKKPGYSGVDLKQVVLEIITKADVVGPDELERFKYQYLIPEETAKKLINFISSGDTEAAKRFEEARHKTLDLAYTQERQLDEKLLKKELELLDREVQLNPETDQYEIKKEEAGKKEEKIEKKKERSRITVELQEDNESYLIEMDSPTRYFGPYEKVSTDAWETEGYIQAKDGSERFIITEAGGFGPFEGINQIKSIHHEVVFEVLQNGKKFILSDSGKKFGPLEEATYVIDIGNGFCFAENTFGGAIVYTSDGRKIKTKFSHISHLTYQLGELIAKATDMEGKIGKEKISLPVMTISENKEEGITFKPPVTKDLGVEHLEMGEPRSVKIIKGEVFYVLRSATDSVLVGEKNVINESQDSNFESIFQMDGKPYVLATAKDGGYYEIISKGATIAVLPKEYDEIFLPPNTTKLHFLAKDLNGKNIAEGSFGQKFGEKYEHKSRPVEINGELSFLAGDSDQRVIVMESGKIIGEGLDRIGRVTEVNGKVVFEFYKDGKYVIGTEDGKEFGKEFADSFNPFDFNGKIAYIGSREGENYFATEDGIKSKIPKQFIVPQEPYIAVGEEIVFQTSLADGKHVIASDTGKILSREFEKIIDFTKFDNSIIVVGIRDGKYIKEVIEFTGEEKPAGAEDRLLELLNLVHKPELEKIKAYFSKHDEKDTRDWKLKLRDRLERSQDFLKRLPEVIKDSPKAFLNTLPAKRDRAVDHLVQKVLFRVFPEIYEKKEEGNFYSKMRSVFGLKNDFGEPRAEAYLENTNGTSFEDGDPLEAQKGKSKDVLELRDNLHELIATGVYGKYNNGRWEKVLFSLPSSVTESAKDVTISIPNVDKVRNVSLPKTLNSRIITERVKGILPGGQEIPLEAEINSLGEGVVLDKKGATEIVYSIEQNQIPEKIRNVDQKEYYTFSRGFEREYGDALTEDLCDLPEELDMFIESISDRTPKEKVFAIEKFVKDMSYYDFDNAEAAPLKRGKSLEEKMMLMEERMDELKEKKPEYAAQLADKKFAGVCADFGLITAALLRRAGIVSGVVSGFSPKGKKITTANAHGVAFVLFPDELNRNKIFTVDGTPHGVNEEEEKKLAELGVLAPSLEETEKVVEEGIAEAQKEAEKQLDEILKVVGGSDEEAIKKLSNGKLESALNTILKYSVKVSHLEALRGVMEAYWYTPVHTLDLGEVKNQVEVGKFFQSQLKEIREKNENNPEASEEKAGNHLFNMIKDFSDRFIAKAQTKNSEESYALLEKVFGLVQTELNETERKAAAVIITYLRAKKIKGENR